MAGDSGYRLGRRPPHPPDVAPRLMLGPLLRPAAMPPTPKVVDWIARVTDWPIYGNDQWGCCVWSAIGHMIEAVTRYGQGATVRIADTDVLRGYTDVTGFNPDAGPPGNNPTDQGTVVQDALGYWRRTGIAGHKIVAFAQVNHRDPGEVATALALFGHLIVGADIPAAAIRQFDRRQPWRRTSPDGGILGGHAVNLGHDTSRRQLAAITWGRPQRLTAGWWTRYVDEAWCVISPEWLSAAGRTPSGLDVAAFGQAFRALTGEPDPFRRAAP